MVSSLVFFVTPVRKLSGIRSLGIQWARCQDQEGRNFDTDTGNDVILTDEDPDGSIKVINTLNHANEAMTFWANKKWFTVKNSYADANAEANVNVPEGAWVDFSGTPIHRRSRYRHDLSFWHPAHRLCRCRSADKKEEKKYGIKMNGERLAAEMRSAFPVLAPWRALMRHRAG